MAKARLLQAVCAVALLAAAPAFAQQTTTQPATTGAGNSVNALRAVELVIFPESMRGTGAGHYDWDVPGVVAAAGSNGG